MNKLKTLAIVGFLFAASAAYGDQFLAFTANTSSLSGQSGYIDFQFNPGPLTSQPATLTILNFSTDGTLAPSAPLGGSIGDVTGALPGTVTLDNGSAYNDYNEGITFGNILSFTLDFGGAAVNNPNGTATSGSDFAFSVFASDDATPLLTSDPNGYAATVAVNLNGTTTSAIESSDVLPTPEPGSLCLLGSGIAAFGTRFLRRRP